MTTYRSIAATETDPYAPIVAQLMKALALNPVAITEGSAGAPKIQPLALQLLPSIIILPGSGTSFVVTGLSAYDLMDWHFGAFSATSTSTGTYNCFISLSSNGGASWAAETLIATASGAGPGVVMNIPEFMVSMRTGILTGTAATWAVGSVAVPGGTPDALRIRLTGSTAFSAGNTRGLFIGLGVV